jgi:hypothetical protein
VISIAISQTTDTFITFQGKKYKIDSSGEVYRRYEPPANSAYWSKLKNSSSKFAMEIKREAGVLKGNEKESKASLRCGSYKAGLGR